MEATQGPAEIVSRLQLTNSHPGAIRFALEPWGEEYTLPPEMTLEVTARGPEGGALEVELAADGVTVWGWAGSVVTLSQDGRPFGADARALVPVDPNVPEQPAATAGEPPAVVRHG